MNATITGPLEWSEEILQEIFRHTPVGVVLSDLHGTIFNANDAFCAMTGYPRDLVVGRPAHSFVFAEDTQRASDFLARLREDSRESRRIVHKVQSRSGRAVWVSTTVSQVVSSSNEPICLIGFVEDIGERLAIETALRESETLYRQVVESQTDMIVRSDAKGIRLFANPAYATFFGLNEPDLTGTSLLPLIFETDRESVLAGMALMTPEDPARAFTYRVIAADGSIRWTEWTSHATFDGGGHLIVLQSIGRDVTDRITANEALRASEARYRRLFGDLPGPAWESDWSALVSFIRDHGVNSTDEFLAYAAAHPDEIPEGIRRVRPLAPNSAALKLAGVDDVAGFSNWLQTAYPPESIPTLMRAVGSLVFDNVTTTSAELSMFTPKGDLRDVVFHWARVRLPESEWHIVNTLSDVTEQRLASEALRRSEAMYRDLFHRMPVAAWEIDWSKPLAAWRAEGIHTADELLSSIGVEGVFQAGQQCDLIVVNQRALDLAGTADETAFSTSRWLAVQPQHREVLARSVGKVLFGEEPSAMIDIGGERADGRLLEAQITSVLNASFPGRLTNAAIDVTVRRTAERELSRSRSLLQQAQELAHLGSWEWSRSASDTLVGSDELWRILGVDGSKDGMTSLRALIPKIDPEDTRRIIGFVTGLSGTPEERIEWASEARVRHDDGSERILGGQAVFACGSDGTIESAYGSLQDITDRKASEEALRQSESLYRLLFHNLPVAVWETDWSPALTRWRKERVETVEDVLAWEQRGNRTREELQALRHLRQANQNALNLVAAPDLESFIEWTLTAVPVGQAAEFVTARLGVILGKKTRTSIEVRVERCDGVLIDMELHMAAQEGLPGRVISAAIDVTEKKRFERDLLHSQRLLESAQAVAHTGSWEISIENDELFGSREFWKIIDGHDGGPPSRKLSTMTERVYADDRAAYWRNLIDAHDEFIASGPSGGERMTEHRIVRPDGSIRATRGQGLFTRTPEGEVRAYGILQDITDQKKAEEAAQRQREELTRADRMISLGILVSGVAHEINNPNHLIMLNAPLLHSAWDNVSTIVDEHVARNGDIRVANLPWSEMRTEIPEIIREIEEGAERIRIIVSELRGFARDQRVGELKTQSVNDIVRGSLRLLANHLRKATTNFTLDLTNDLPPIDANAQRLEQVIVNLVLNSCQALPDTSAAISVSTGFNRDERRVEIRVVDHGIGIKPDDLKKILDPFFTTKRAEGGMGLGLAVSDRIVQEHNGLLTFESEPGSGTTAIVSLPVSGKE